FFKGEKCPAGFLFNDTLCSLPKCSKPIFLLSQLWSLWNYCFGSVNGNFHCSPQKQRPWNIREKRVFRNCTSYLLYQYDSYYRIKTENKSLESPLDLVV